MPADERTRGTWKNITRYLAELEFLFTLGQDDEGERVWHLTFSAEQLPFDTSVLVTLRETSVVAYSLVPGPIPANTFKRLLRLNEVIRLAKVGLTETEDILIWSEVPIADFDQPSRLHNAVAAVVGGVTEVQTILSASPGSALGQDQG